MELLARSDIISKALDVTQKAHPLIKTPTHVDSDSLNTGCLAHIFGHVRDTVNDILVLTETGLLVFVHSFTLRSTVAW